MYMSRFVLTGQSTLCVGSRLDKRKGSDPIQSERDIPF
jgi:hypothetical protein